MICLNFENISIKNLILKTNLFYKPLWIKHIRVPEVQNILN